MHPISATTDLLRARALAAFTQSEQDELARLPQEISEVDPAAKATILDNAATRVDELADAIGVAAEEVSDDALDAADRAYQTLLEAEAAESAASSLLQAGDSTVLLPRTGQGPWALLFRAAREYSTGVAYPGQTFPVTGDGAQCVLCQQDLSPAAKERFQRFDRFVRDAASEAAQAARSAWQLIVRQVGDASVTFSASRVMLDSLGGGTATLLDDIRIFQEDLQSRLQWLRTAVVGGAWHDKPTYRSQNPVASIRQIAGNLRTEAATLRANLDVEALAAKRLRLKELEARLLLSEHVESIARVVHNLLQRAKLQNCLEDVGTTRQITLFAGRLAKKYVSEALAGKMNEELRKLDLYHIRAGVSSAGDAGSVRLGIVLQESRLDPHLVLSEAEQRMCALAYFFAELHQSGSTSGVVFDDPVSSLDHSHRTAVARRIVENLPADKQSYSPMMQFFWGTKHSLRGCAANAFCKIHQLSSRRSWLHRCRVAL
ncbi:hypothetical protein QT383_06595 [Stenotrophomonas rhizophila]